nr:unnamed protein product [Digitaria exilis]
MAPGGAGLLCAAARQQREEGLAGAVLLRGGQREQGTRSEQEAAAVLKTWGNRLEKSQREKQLEQLQLCAEIGKECTKDDPRRRPDALTIVRRLHEADITDISVLTDMSNLSIAQEEQHGDGCNSIGAIGSKQSLEYLVRMSRSEYGSVARQSRDFRSLVRSGEIYRLRRMAGVAEHWIYLSCNFVEWNAYDPDRQHWIEVPKMPEDEFFRNAYMESLAVGTNLLVFGLGKGKERILLKLLKYSIRTNSWIRTDPMNYPRCLFGSASVGHKAYLAGGIDCYERVVLSSVEMHDCEKNNWAPLPNMNKARMLCSGVFMDGKLYVIGGKGSNNEELTCGEEYDFEQGSWNVIENMTEGLNVRLSSGAPPLVEVVNNQLYGADYIEKNVKKYDKQNNRWITLGRWPESIASSSMNGCTKHDVLERMMVDESVNPTDLPLSLLEYITNGFSDDVQIGEGGFAVVYKSHVITSKLFGSLGYLTPEVYCGRITFKSDIYSLGVIMIEILTREKDVLKNWGNKLETKHREKQLEQLHLCAEIGKECTKDDPRRRPDALTIVRRLHEADIVDISTVSEMSKLSITQEEQHDNGCGAIGRKLSLKCLVGLSQSEYGSLASSSQEFRSLVHNHEYGSMASVSREFQSLVHSGEIDGLRQQTGVAKHWIYFSCNVLEWDAYEPDQQRWIKVPKMPTDECFSLSYKESLAVGTDLLVFGKGRGVERTLFSLNRYSILTNSWIRTDPMNYPRALFGSASIGNKAYLAGGIDCYGRVLSLVEMYDSDKRDWEPLPSMVRARQLYSGVFMDGKLFVIGGEGSNNEILTCGEEYDFELGSWRVIENMSEGLNAQVKSRGAPPLVAVVNNELYGADYTELYVKKYDKENNRWVTLGKWPENASSTIGWGIHFKACGDQLIIIGVPKRFAGNAMVELYSCVSDSLPPVWNLIARRCSSGIFLYNAAVISC